MKIYIAHNYEARYSLRIVVTEIERAGHEVTSNWIKHEPVHDQHLDALVDIGDIDKADLVVMFADPFQPDKTGRGKWFEFGYAYHADKKIWLIGDYDNACVFSALVEPENRLNNVFDLLQKLGMATITVEQKEKQ